MAGEFEPAGLAIHPEGSNVVAALIAAIEEPAGRVEVERARIVSSRPFLPEIRQIAVRANGKHRDAVVQPVTPVDESPIGGDQNLGAEVAAGKPGRQSRDRLARRQPPGARIVVEQDDRRAFFLDRVQPAAVGMKAEMA